MDYDLIVIGAGTAGSSAAKAAVKIGARVAIVEEESFAGTCLARGWIPKKVLVSTVELFWRAREGRKLGLRGTESLALDWKAIIERKDGIVQSWSKGKEAGLSGMGISIVRGKAKFVAPHEIAVDGKKISGEKSIIATGSKPARPDIPGAEIAITSDELIHLKEQPARLVVVGGGFIGLEFGFALARAGSRVTILQSGPQIGPALDDEIRDLLLKMGREAGIDILTSVEVRSILIDKTVEARVAGKMQNFLGLHVIGAHAEDIVQLGAVAMRGGLKKSEMGSMHYVFPTLGGAIFDAMAAR